MLYQDRIVPLESLYLPTIVKPWSADLATAFPVDPELAQSFELLGQLQNVIVMKTGDRYAVIAGQRRYQVAQALGWEFISVKVISGEPSDARLAAIASAEDLFRRHLTAPAIAAGQVHAQHAVELLALEDRAETSQPLLFPPPIDHAEHWTGCSCASHGPFSPFGHAREPRP